MLFRILLKTRVFLSVIVFLLQTYHEFHDRIHVQLQMHLEVHLYDLIIYMVQVLSLHHNRMRREELEVIAPAVESARAQGWLVSGPFAPDTVFMRARANNGQPGEFDVVVAMYHDQGLIPVKYLGLDNGVNVTLGLPLVRTSPDHGTAFDIAGTGQADPASLLQALRMARKLSHQLSQRQRAISSDCPESRAAAAHPLA